MFYCTYFHRHIDAQCAFEGVSFYRRLLFFLRPSPPYFRPSAGGAFVEPCDGAALLFSGPDEAQRFVDKDPYNTAGLVTKYQVCT